MVQGRGGAPALRRDLVDEVGVHPAEALEGGGLGWDVGHLPGGAGGLGLRDPPGVVERVQEVAERIGRGERPVQEAGEPRIGLEDADVVEALAPRGEEEDHGFDLRGFAVAALALADVDVCGDGLVQAERAHRLHDEGQPGAPRHRVGPLDHLHRVRQEARAHRGGRRPAGRAFSKATFTSVSASTSSQRRWYAAIHASTVARSPCRM